MSRLISPRPEWPVFCSPFSPARVVIIPPRTTSIRSHPGNVGFVQNRLPGTDDTMARQAHRKGSPGLPGGCHGKAPAVGPGDFSGDVQAQANAAGTVYLRVFGTGTAY